MSGKKKAEIIYGCEDEGYQNQEIAQQAFYLRTHIQVLSEELAKFSSLIKESDAPQGTKEWLGRVQVNVFRNFRPAMDNLDQVRCILDKKSQGLPE